MIFSLSYVKVSYKGEIAMETRPYFTYVRDNKRIYLLGFKKK
jgi:hypothetical protein